MDEVEEVITILRRYQNSVNMHGNDDQKEYFSALLAQLKRSLSDEIRELEKQKINKLVNLTPHDIHFYPVPGKLAFTTILPAYGYNSSIGRCPEVREQTSDLVFSTDVGMQTARIYRIMTQKPSDLPPVSPGVVFIVSRITAEVMKDERDDLVFPDDLIRSDNGEIMGCRAFGTLSETLGTIEVELG